MNLDDEHGRYVLDEHGEPRIEPDLFAWARWFGTTDRHVAETMIDDRLLVSTIFLGLDHNHARYWSDGPHVPILWETMIFGDEGAPVLDYQERYSSREDALKGHTRAENVARRALQESDAKVARWEQDKADGKFDGKLAKPPRL